jgi:GT2 family glycosyltransferase
VAELLLLDDAGDPPLAAAELEEWARTPVRLHRFDRRVGAPHARNLAAGLVHTEWILYSDDDVFLGPGYVGELLAAQARTGAALTAGRRLYLQDGESVGEVEARYQQLPKDPWDPRLFMAEFGAPITGDVEALHLQTTMLARASVARELGWDEESRPPSYREETDFCLRAVRAGHRVVFCGAALCYHLPPSATHSGGQRAARWWQYEWGVVSCNRRFLDRYYSFLRERGAIEGPRWLAELRFADWRFRGGAARALYRTYCASGLRPLVRRLLRRPSADTAP